MSFNLLSVPFTFTSAPSALWVLRFGLLNVFQTPWKYFRCTESLIFSFTYYCLYYYVNFVLHPWNLFFYMVLCVSDNVCCSFLSYWLSLLIHFKYFSLIASQCFNLLVKVSLHILNIYLHLLNIHYGDFFVKVLDRIPYFVSVCLTLM